MKKLLTIFGSIVLMSSPIITTSNVVSCFGISFDGVKKLDGSFEDIDFINWSKFLSLNKEEFDSTLSKFDDKNDELMNDPNIDGVKKIRAINRNIFCNTSFWNTRYLL